ncbi:MAG: hypothetical protein JWO06_3144 [Bacteroidota bacterium]|nr:hypothetical protein [Bacteroidota bacterium]
MQPLLNPCRPVRRAPRKGGLNARLVTAFPDTAIAPYLKNNKLNQSSTITGAIPSPPLWGGFRRGLYFYELMM